MVAGACLVAVDLFLRALRLREYYGSRDRDVYSFSDRDTRCRSTAISGSAVPCLLLKPGSSVNALRYNTRTDLLRRGLHNTTNLVDARTDHVVDNYLRLEFGRIYLVEDSQTLVIRTRLGHSQNHLAVAGGYEVRFITSETKPWQDIPEHRSQRRLGSRKDLESRW